MGTGAAEWVWENSRASNGPLILMLVIAREIDAKGNCTMTVAEMAARSRLSERSVQGALREAERLGELTVTPCGRRGYSLCLAMGADSAPLPASRGAESAPPQNLHPAESAPQEPEEPQVKAKGAESAPHQISDKRSTTGLPVVEKPSSERPDVDRLCAHLADRIEANGAKRPNITKRWETAARLLIDNDGRTEKQVHNMIDWCQDSEFWRSNIMSMPKLREKYDSLKMKAMAAMKPAAGSRQQETDGLFDRAMARAIAREEAENAAH